jgi:hypothetical protein
VNLLGLDVEVLVQFDFKGNHDDRLLCVKEDRIQHNSTER